MTIPGKQGEIEDVNTCVSTIRCTSIGSAEAMMTGMELGCGFESRGEDDSTTFLGGAAALGGGLMSTFAEAGGSGAGAVV